MDILFVVVLFGLFSGLNTADGFAREFLSPGMETPMQFGLLFAIWLQEAREWLRHRVTIPRICL